MSRDLIRICTAVFFGYFCLTNAWAGKVPPKNASDYGGLTDSECMTPTFDLSGVTATCFLPSNGISNSFLFNFTVDSPSNQTSSFSVNSFQVSLPSEFDDFGLLFGCSSSSPGATPLPCSTSSSGPLPFDVNSTGTAGLFDFTGFTGSYSGQVSVFLDCASAGNCVEPSITSISTGTTSTPEPRFYAVLIAAIVLGAIFFRRFAAASKAS